MSYDNTNSGALFKNSRKVEGDTLPDYTGNINVNGEEFYLSSWINKDKDGKSYMSLRVNLKDKNKDYDGVKTTSQTKTENIPF